VVSARRGPLGRPSDGGDATRFKAGDGGEGSACRVGALTAWSMGRVSGTGGKGVWGGDDGVGRISGLWAADCDSELCRMSRICCLKAKGSQVRTSGWKPWK